MFNPQPPAPDPQSPTPALYACVYQPPLKNSASSACSAANIPAANVLTELAEAFSPRYERHGVHLVIIDIRGLDRLIGSPSTIGNELRREAAARGLRAHIAIARTCTAAMVLALSSPGVRVVDAGQEPAALASIPIGVLEKLNPANWPQSTQNSQNAFSLKSSAISASSAAKGTDVLAALTHWGIRSLGEFAALPSADVAARLGRDGVAWQVMARGEDTRPLVPSRADERFDATLELEWPIEGLEPLSFVLTRLFEPLSTRLEARDRGAAALHIELGLVTREPHRRSLELPSPLRDVRTLRTLALLDLESHPPAAAIDRVTITIDPTPGRVLQHTLFTRPHPTPEQLSTLLARLGALMGQDRIGAPAQVDSYRPGAFEMKPFAIEHDHDDQRRIRRDRRDRGTNFLQNSLEPFSQPSPESQAPSLKSPIPSPESRVPSLQHVCSAADVTTALRRCRQPVPARVAVGSDGRPVRVTTDRRGFAGGGVTACVGPWRTSGEWWETGAGAAGKAGGAGKASEGWDRDEWDVSLNDGAVYRIFRDRSTEAWFVEAIVD